MSTVHYLNDDPAAKRLRAARLEVHRLRIAQAAERLRQHWPTATAVEMDTRHYNTEDPATRALLSGSGSALDSDPLKPRTFPCPWVQIIENTNTYISDALSTGVHSSWPEAVHSTWLDTWDRATDPDGKGDDADSEPDNADPVEGDYLNKLVLPDPPK